jgi:hypothetical protein
LTNAPIFSLLGIIVRFALFNNPVATFYQPGLLLWAAAEVCTGLICLCVPPLSILLHGAPRPRRHGQALTTARPSDSTASRKNAPRQAWR